MDSYNASLDTARQKLEKLGEAGKKSAEGQDL
jgi:hypothetical protein